MVCSDLGVFIGLLLVSPGWVSRTSLYLEETGGRHGGLERFRQEVEEGG